ncbi:MAG: hypothetical protein IJY26_02440, partial [Clostridia bacterium]|nr:hypothetical protein [Clostridia bacterium]
MEKILVSDTGEHSARIAYIYNALSALLPGSSLRPKIFVGQTRSAIAAEEATLTPELLRSVKELLTETVAIGYKYGYLSARLPLERLTLEDRKFFLCALIAADLPADKRYIRSRLSEVEACALDGFFSFRLQPL